MSNPFVGEIRIVGFGFAPRGWADCDGQLLAVSQFDALFSLFGTVYGGDGRTTFGLPDLRGRVAIHMGSGPGLTPRAIGSKAGAEQVSLNAQQNAAHSHNWQATTAGAQNTTAINNALAEASTDAYGNTTPPQSPVNMASSMVAVAGNGQPHDNLQPFQVLRYIVSLFGVYPSRS